MKIIERFAASAKGDKTEDLIVETEHFIGVFDGVSGVRADWLKDNKTMGQWAAQLAGDALRELHHSATIADYARIAVDKNIAARAAWGLDRTDRLASGALILPRRRPLEVWVIGDSHFGYKRADGSWTGCPQEKYYDQVTLAYRQLLITQDILERGQPRTAAERAALFVTGGKMLDALQKQMLWANHPDPSEKFAFGIITGIPVPGHLMQAHSLPEDTAEVVLCSDGFAGPSPSLEEGLAIIRSLRENDPFLIGKNPQQLLGFKGGFVQSDGSIAEWYDDAAYLRIAV